MWILNFVYHTYVMWNITLQDSTAWMTLRKTVALLQLATPHAHRWEETVASSWNASHVVGNVFELLLVSFAIHDMNSTETFVA